MSWLVLLGIAVIFTALAALMGVQPKGAKEVTNTGLMTGARYALFGLGGICLLLALRGYFTG